MAYGTPASLDDVEAYYTHIRHGRPPEAARLAELVGRYESIGGTSPLAEVTEAQRVAIAARLEQVVPGGFIVEVGTKHAPPFIEDTVTALARAGVSRIVGLALAPHYSRATIGEYHARATAAAAAAGIDDYDGIDHWHLEPSYVGFLADAIRDARAAMAPRTHVVFTAHSLPERALEGDPYVDELHTSAAAVADRVGLAERDWSLGWQSAGRTADAWRGPDIGDVIDSIAAADDHDGVLVCPQGFVADHLEVLYDLDVVARARADAAGIAFVRTRSLNDDPTVMAALADRIVAAAAAIR
ncbi:MAG: ferrochelatase [Actinobacteria bacterium]|nr:ferrochelatase [Actinomycetota bacterium]